MSETLSYQLELDNGPYVGPMRDAIAEVRQLEAISSKIDGTGLDAAAAGADAVAATAKKATTAVAALESGAKAAAAEVAKLSAGSPAASAPALQSPAEIKAAAATAAAETAELYRKMREDDAALAKAVVENWNRNGKNPHTAQTTSAPPVDPGDAAGLAAGLPEITGFGGMLEATAAQAVTLKRALDDAEVAVRDLNTTSQDDGLGPLSGDLQEALGPLTTFTVGGLTLESVLSASVVAFGGFIAAASGAGIVLGVVTAAVMASQAALAASDTAEAADSMARFKEESEGLAAALGDVGSQFVETAAELVQPITLTVNDNITGVLAQARRDMEYLRGLVGLGRKGFDATEEASKRVEAGGSEKGLQMQAQRDADAQSIRDYNDDIAARDAREERSLRSQETNDRRAAVSREQVARQARDRTATAQDQVFRDRLSKEGYLQQRIDALKKEGVPTARDVNALPQNSPQQAAAATRLALMVHLEKELADIKAQQAREQATAAEHSAREAESAERKAKAEQKVLDARKQAASTFQLENSILEARAAGNGKLVKQLERQQAVEETKKRLMSDQGLSESAAAAAAERRQSLKELAEKREAHPNRIRVYNEEESAARRLARRSASDQARDDRWNHIGLATKAAAGTLANPDGTKKDHTETVSRKLDRLASIDEKLENLAVA